MITLLSVGKPKFYARQIEEYLKRINRYRPIIDIAVKEAKDQNVEIIKKKEGECLQQKAGTGIVIALHETGKQYDTIAFSKLLQKHNAITFIIGGAFGLSSDVLQKAQIQLSLSPMTLQHELAQLVLLEQIYRGCSILRGEKYHK
ncbi:TPA: 23S rRNA (pseudouridine(1915)-N(3))-methyltransferase RlmH [Candidatus Woesearchaeota archaeon]|nr:23S rRNA (pseudouridine(1915)-N(3))-methyltransferase RlmH [Candidatus Woesearchaeota archaeon]HII69041.1 23S rRNA (pseudouridine(1915)-N(3))-methyltransferase RlmH [Candidatus Woesearchaeota archaeon]